MKTPPERFSTKGKIASMKKQMRIFLAIGILFLISGIVMLSFQITASVIPVILISLGCSVIAVFISARGGAVIRDEMAKRTDILSGYYTCNATLFFLFACGIMNWFIPLPLSVSGLLLTMMMFISFTFICIRFFLTRKGITE
jgi:hypothetical protein